jgi:multidrug efflux pump subunit AcrB
MTRFSLRFPYFIIVGCLLTVLVGVTSLLRMPVDLFPKIDIPVVVVATFFSGMPPEQIENNITGRFERFFTLASGIDHIESRSLPGVSLIKVFFKPGQNSDTAVSTIANLASANLRRLPPGTMPPVVLKFDASSLPVCLITMKGEGLTETQLRDAGQYAVRNQVAGVDGASVPQPFGGKYRQIMVYVDPLRLESHQLSVMDVVRAVNDSNLILPAGDVRVGPFTHNVYANSQLRDVEDVNRLPLKTVGRSSVLVGDVGTAKDASQVQANVVRLPPRAKARWGCQHNRGGRRGSGTSANPCRCPETTRGPGCFRPVHFCPGCYRQPASRRAVGAPLDWFDDLLVFGKPPRDLGGVCVDSAIGPCGNVVPGCWRGHGQYYGSGRLGSGIQPAH